MGAKRGRLGWEEKPLHTAGCCVALGGGGVNLWADTCLILCLITSLAREEQGNLIRRLERGPDLWYRGRGDVLLTSKS